jgi:maltose alpha-D-glucosyltransferase/alpha-amylase
MGDNIELFDRNGVRTPMQWNAEPGAGFSEAPVHSRYAPVINDDVYGSARVNVEFQRGDPKSLWNIIRHMISTRKQHPAFGRGEIDWVDPQNDQIAAFRRTYEGETIFVIHNLSDGEQRASLKTQESPKILTDLLTQKEFSFENGTLVVQLQPYQYLWLA